MIDTIAAETEIYVLLDRDPTATLTRREIAEALGCTILDTYVPLDQLANSGNVVVTYPHHQPTRFGRN